LSYALQNLLISLFTTITSSASFFFTLFVILPLACLRTLLPHNFFVLRGVIGSPQGIVNGENGGTDMEREKVRLSQLRRNRVILVLGASRGIGFNVVKQHANEENTSVIATSSSMGALKSGLGISELENKVSVGSLRCPAQVDQIARRHPRHHPMRRT
jgi:hypothetical protein